MSLRVKIHDGRAWFCIGVQQINTSLAHGEITPIAQVGCCGDALFFSAFDWHLPEATSIKFGIVEISCVIGLEGSTAAVVRNLRLSPVRHGPLPNFPLASAVGREIESGSIARPARYIIFVVSGYDHNAGFGLLNPSDKFDCNCPAGSRMQSTFRPATSGASRPNFRLCRRLVAADSFHPHCSSIFPGFPIASTRMRAVGHQVRVGRLRCNGFVDQLVFYSLSYRRDGR